MDSWDSGGGVVVVQVFQNTIAVEAFTREALMIQSLGCDNLTNLKAGDFYGVASGWEEEKRTELGTFLVYKAFKIFLQEGERQIRPADLKSWFIECCEFNIIPDEVLKQVFII